MGNLYKIKSSPYSTVVFCPKSSSTVSASLEFICGNQHYASYWKTLSTSGRRMRYNMLSY